ncbi:hypothetical protein GQ457_06G036610 [Hibiscus cannabinus]
MADLGILINLMFEFRTLWYLRSADFEHCERYTHHDSSIVRQGSRLRNWISILKVCTILIMQRPVLLPMNIQNFREIPLNRDEGDKVQEVLMTSEWLFDRMLIISRKSSASYCLSLKWNSCSRHLKVAGSVVLDSQLEFSVIHRGASIVRRVEKLAISILKVWTI